MEKEQLQHKYSELSKKLSKIGYICKGSVMVLNLKCGNLKLWITYFMVVLTRLLKGPAIAKNILSKQKV